MLRAISGPHPSDPLSLVVNSELQPLKGVTGLQVEWRPLLGNTLLDDEIRSCCEEVLEELRGAGAQVRLVDEPFENAEPAWRVLQQSNWAARYYAKLAEVESQIEPAFAEGIRAGGEYTGQQLLAATVKRTQFFRAVQTWFDRCDIVATPTMSRPPMAASHPIANPITVNGKEAGDMRVAWVPYLNVFNLTGHPALSVPAGFTSAGLPVGLQLVGRWHEEAQLLRVAAEVERLRPWAGRLPPHAQ
jgi:aspartyl-tRNA(Asn)/glutamyl-tRNA(Gln) amidotransferase subunit A